MATTTIRRCSPTRRQSRSREVQFRCMAVATSSTAGSSARGRRCGGCRGGSKVGSRSVMGEENAHAKPLLKALDVARARSKLWTRGSSRARHSQNELASEWVVWRKLSRVPRRRRRFAWRRLQRVNAVCIWRHKFTRLQHKSMLLWVHCKRRIAERTGCSVGCSNSCFLEARPSVDGRWFTLFGQRSPVPSEIQDLEHRLSCRNCELRNLEHGDAGTVACGSLVAQGAAVLASLTQDVPMNARSSLLSSTKGTTRGGASKEDCKSGQ